MNYFNRCVSNSLVITVDPWLVDVSGSAVVVVAPDVVATVLSEVPDNPKRQ